MTRLKKLFLLSVLTTLLFASGGYWYVFIAGVPQLDAPQVEEVVKDLTFETKTFTSAAMGQERRYGLVLPPGYNPATKTRYPVIVLLHGGHGDERDYQRRAGLTTVLNTLYRDNRLPPSIVITPDGNDLRGTSPFWDSQYYDGPNGKLASLIADDLVKEVKAKYKVLGHPKYWAIGGLSSGGWGAMNIGIRRPDRFNVFFSHTGYFRDPNGSAQDPITAVDKIPRRLRSRFRVYLDAGENDSTYLEATQEFHKKLQTLGISSELNVFPGGHGIVGADSGWNYWRKHLHDSLTYVGHQFRTKS
jgi:enterochelin esterase-like enzyme